MNDRIPWYRKRSKFKHSSKQCLCCLNMKSSSNLLTFITYQVVVSNSYVEKKSVKSAERANERTEDTRITISVPSLSICYHTNRSETFSFVSLVFFSIYQTDTCIVLLCLVFGRVSRHNLISNCNSTTLIDFSRKNTYFYK